jgi:hypothetical protein
MVFRGVPPSRKPCCTKRGWYNVKHVGLFLMRFWTCSAKRSKGSLQNMTVNPGCVVFLRELFLAPKIETSSRLAITVCLYGHEFRKIYYRIINSAIKYYRKVRFRILVPPSNLLQQVIQLQTFHIIKIVRSLYNPHSEIRRIV